MSIDYFGKPISLRDWLTTCLEDPDNGAWMVFKGERYDLDMLVYPVLVDTSNMEPEEYMETEDAVHATGFYNCMNPDQLADIVMNLRRQHPQYSDRDLEKALNHYDEHDCFLNIGL